jgi:hypothetical protein
MTKKQMKAWLTEQIQAAILNVSGDYSVTEQGDYVFILPEVGTNSLSGVQLIRMSIKIQG